MHYSLIFLAFVAILGTVNAGPLAYGICQAGCLVLVVSCYGTGGIGAPTVARACKASYKVCRAACAVAISAPAL